MPSHPSCAAPSPFPAAPLTPRRKEGGFLSFPVLSLRLPAAARGVAGPFPPFPLGLSSTGPGSSRAHGPPTQLTPGFLLLFPHETARDARKKKIPLLKKIPLCALFKHLRYYSTEPRNQTGLG